MMKLMLLWVMLVSSTCFAQYMDADNFEEAIAMAATKIRSVDGIRQHCMKLFPEKARDINSLSLHWLDRNRKEYFVVKTYSQQANPEWLLNVEKTAALGVAAQENLPQSLQVRYCQNYYGTIKTGDQDISKKTPRVSQFLAEYMIKNPPSESTRALDDYVMGCIKQANNRAIEYQRQFVLDKTRAVCECVGDVYVSNTTPEERALEEKHLVERQSIADLAHVKKITPLFQSCALRG